MSTDIQTVLFAVRKAENDLNDADRTIKNVSNSMACLLRDRLKAVNCSVLADLKRELKDFNAHTGEWK